MRIDLVAELDKLEWCPGCLTTSVVVFKLHRLEDEGVSEFGTYRSCTRCDESDRP